MSRDDRVVVLQKLMLRIGLMSGALTAKVATSCSLVLEDVCRMIELDADDGECLRLLAVPN
jgi:hypothetical protein